MNTAQAIGPAFASLGAARRALYVGVAVVVLIAVSSAGWILNLLYEEAIRHAKVTTQNLAQTLQKSVERMIDQIDVSLQVCADEIARQRALGPPNASQITGFLERQQSRLSGVAYVRATDERGDILYGPGVVSPPVNQSDRAFFILQRDQPRTGLYVEKPLMARINRQWVWPFSRRISLQDGSFGGVVFGSIMLDQVEAQFSRIHLGPGGVVVLRDAELGLISRFPNPEPHVAPVGDRRISDAFARAFKDNPVQGSFVSDATTVDRVARVVSYHRSEKYGFVMGVGISYEEAMEEWRQQAWFVGTAAAALVVTLLIAASLVERAWRRQERDMALLQASRQAAAQARQNAEEANRAKSEFLASMSHELRTPLNAVLGFAQLIGEDSDVSRPTREGAAEIQKAGEHLLSLVNDLIDLARIESGKLDMSLAPVRVKGVLAKCLAMVATLANKQGVALVDNIQLDDTVAVYADTIRLRQVVINFLSNAIKYKRAQGSVVTLSGVRRDGIVRISVADNGPGISEANQARVFNAFDRLGREAGSEEGAGIGLVISKRIVDAMGGRIGFDSVVGVGSTFWLELSVVDGVAESAPDAPEAGTLADAGAPHAARHRVLYIEDNPMNQRLMKRIFEARKNLELDAADSAELGIEMARTEQPILILMDINLPGIDGYEALKLLRSDPRTANIPVIALSANAMKGDRERGFNAGFADYIVKPIDVKKMHGIVDRVIAGRDATRFDLR